MTLLDNRFELRHQLGAGGMAEVYLARDHKLDRDVAIKLLNAASSRNPGLSERFRKECKALAKLTHRNIVSLYDSGETDDGRFYLVMEHLRGETLGDLFHRLHQQGRLLPWRRLAGMVRQTCLALHAAHARQIVHRDVKPSNIFIEEGPPDEDWIKVLDFGIAKFTSGHDSEAASRNLQLTATGHLVGTVHYMAPESIEPDYFGPVDGRADIYGLGVILYQGVSGTLPHEGRPRAIVFSKTAFDEPPPLRERAQHVSEAVEALVMRAIARLPEKRFTTITELVDALDAITDTSMDRPARMHRLAGHDSETNAPVVEDSPQEAPVPSLVEKSLTDLTTIGGAKNQILESQPPQTPPQSAAAPAHSSAEASQGAPLDSPAAAGATEPLPESALDAVEAPPETPNESTGRVVVGAESGQNQPPPQHTTSEPSPRRRRSTAWLLVHALIIWFILILAWRFLRSPTNPAAVAENEIKTVLPVPPEPAPAVSSTGRETEGQVAEIGETTSEDLATGTEGDETGQHSTGEGSTGTSDHQEQRKKPVKTKPAQTTTRELAKLLAGFQSTVENCAEGQVMDGVKYALSVSVEVIPPQRELRITKSTDNHRPFPPKVKTCILSNLQALRVGPDPTPASASREFVVN